MLAAQAESITIGLFLWLAMRRDISPAESVRSDDPDVQAILDDILDRVAGRVCRYLLYETLGGRMLKLIFSTAILSSYLASVSQQAAGWILRSDVPLGQVPSNQVAAVHRAAGGV